MKIITTYGPGDLENGKCTCCNQESNEILIDDGKCIDCIQMIEFEEITTQIM